MDDHILVRFNLFRGTSSERTSAFFFIDHHAFFKDYYLCSLQKTVEKDLVR